MIKKLNLNNIENISGAAIEILNAPREAVGNELLKKYSIVMARNPQILEETIDMFYAVKPTSLYSLFNILNFLDNNRTSAAYLEDAPGHFMMTTADINKFIAQNNQKLFKSTIIDKR